MLSARQMQSTVIKSTRSKTPPYDVCFLLIYLIREIISRCICLYIACMNLLYAKFLHIYNSKSIICF